MLVKCLDVYVYEFCNVLKDKGRDLYSMIGYSDFKACFRSNTTIAYDQLGRTRIWFTDPMNIQIARNYDFIGSVPSNIIRAADRPSKFREGELF